MQITSNLVDANHPATLVSGVTYAPNGAIKQMLYGNGLTEARYYNNRLQPCRLNVNSSASALSACSGSAPSGTVQDFTYGFNAGTSDNGNVMTWSAMGNQVFSRTFVYDPLNRISTMTQSSGNPTTCSSAFGLSWNIDPWGNASNQNVTSGSCMGFNYATTTQNQITGSPFTIDAAGNMTHDALQAYTFDAEERVSSTSGSLGSASYTYDARGRRITKTIGSAPRDYVYDTAGNVLAEMTSAGWQVGHVYLGGDLIAEYNNGTTYFVTKDHLGSTRLVTALNQSVYDSLDYLPFGQQIAGATATSHKFTGKERDSESGLDNFEARYNSSSLGRFMSPDPANFGAVDEYPQTWNAYSYVTNNPLNATDPNGLDCIYAGTASDNPNPGGAGTVTVVRGDCVNAGGKNDSGVFVDGTVDTDKPITSDAATGDLTFGLTNDKGAYGTGIATNFSDPQSPGSSDQLNPFAQGVFSQINKMPIKKFIGVVYGGSVVIGLTGGAACYYLCPEAATISLAGETGTDLIESTNTLNKIIGGPQRELLKEFFETGKAPEGLSQRTLQIYKDIAQRAVAAGKDQLGVQAQRIQMISNALK